jgi:hypothetical protein
MNYLIIYNNLINRAIARDKPLLYTENHHIVPRCMGGKDNIPNLVRLTPEEHYVAHQLLVKIYPDNHLLIYAATMMCVQGTSHNKHRSGNKLYGWLRRRLSVAARIRGTGENGSQYGTCWIHDTILQVSKKIHKDTLQDWLDIGWNPGRVMNFNKPIKPNKIDKRKIIKQETDSRYLLALLNSSSISNALRSLGLQTRGAGYSRMKDVIIRHNLQNKFVHEYITWGSKI